MPSDKTQLAEASRRLPAAFHQKHAHLPWKKIMGAGNVHRHDYDNVEESMIWPAISEDLPKLLKVVSAELDQN